MSDDIPDPLDRELTERVADATPATVPPFDHISRRARRQRLRSGMAIAASVAVVAGSAFGAWSLRTSDHEPSPTPPVSSPTTTAPNPSPTEVAFPDPENPSGIVMQLPGADVEMPADTSCWRKPEDCSRGLQWSGADLDLGTHDFLEFRFAKPGWDFVATFRQADETCPNAVTVDATRTGEKTFRLDPAGLAGPHDVDLVGHGPEGTASTKFLWTTTSDGPIDLTTATVGLFPNSRGLGSFGLEVDFFDLPFTPEEEEVSPTAQVKVTGSDGTATTWNPPLIVLSMDCGDYDEGNYYYQGEWEEEFASLGGGPFDLEVRVEIVGTTYVGQARWQKIKGESSMVPITFTPPLPGAS